jgi:hypothetical protein
MWRSKNDFTNEYGLFETCLYFYVFPVRWQIDWFEPEEENIYYPAISYFSSFIVLYERTNRYYLGEFETVELVLYQTILRSTWVYVNWISFAVIAMIYFGLWIYVLCILTFIIGLYWLWLPDKKWLREMYT